MWFPTFLPACASRSADKLLSLMDKSGVEKALIVQPIIYLYDHSCASLYMLTHPLPRTCLCVVDADNHQLLAPSCVSPFQPRCVPCDPTPADVKHVMDAHPTRFRVRRRTSCMLVSISMYLRMYIYVIQHLVN